MNRNINGKLEFTLQLKAVDFRGTEFNDCNKCVIEKAILRQLGTNSGYEFVDSTIIEDKEFKHKKYGSFMFGLDKVLAVFKVDNTVIRELILTEV